MGGALLLSLSLFPSVVGGGLPKEVRQFLETADRFELISLDPVATNKQRPYKGGFHNWIVLGQTIINDVGVRRKIISELDKGLASSDGIGAQCFNPRHGIQARKGAQSLDLVICFECQCIKVVHPSVAGAPDRSEMLTTTKEPQPALDAILRDAKVPLPQKSASKAPTFSLATRRRPRAAHAAVRVETTMPR